MNNFYNKLFANRSVISFLIVVMLLLFCILRVAVISTGDYAAIQAEQASYRIKISRLRGTVYDCNMVPLTNTASKTVAAVLPTSKAIAALSKAADDSRFDNALEILENNQPTVCDVNREIKSEGIAFTKVFSHHSAHLSACHLVGYTDSDGHGISGIELAYDDILFSKKFVSAVFTVDGKGNVLRGTEPYFENDSSVINSGVVTTLDINIQNITESAASKMNSGCAIVAEVSSGKIKAMASVPQFDVNNLYESLNGENSPLINRALLAYSVGSVFKPCVAAAAIREGLGDCVFNCEGSLKIADRIFRCHVLSGHGDMNLCNALAKSCNCYFYNLGMMLRGNAIYKTASSLNFGAKIKLGENLYTAAGVLPDLRTLETDGTLANLSIGQGDLLLSPVSMLTLYLSIAGDGCYYLPSVIEKTLKDGVEKTFDKGEKTRVMSENTAAILRNYLKGVVTDGTGSEAAPKFTTAAGKTATAQTGRYYDDKSEITNSWFCGFFPAEEPKYVVVVMSDSKLSVSTASVFAEIADGITQFENKNV